MFSKRSSPQPVPVTDIVTTDIAIGDLLMIVATTTPHDGSPRSMVAVEYTMEWFITNHPSHPQPTARMLDNGDQIRYDIWRFVTTTVDGQPVIHWLDHSKGLPVSTRQSTPEEFAATRSALRSKVIIDSLTADSLPVPARTWGPFLAFKLTHPTPDSPTPINEDLVEGFASLTY